MHRGPSVLLLAHRKQTKANDAQVKDAEVNILHETRTYLRYRIYVALIPVPHALQCVANIHADNHAVHPNLDQTRPSTIYPVKSSQQRHRSCPISP